MFFADSFHARFQKILCLIFYVVFGYNRSQFKLVLPTPRKGKPFPLQADPRSLSFGCAGARMGRKAAVRRDLPAEAGLPTGVTPGFYGGNQCRGAHGRWTGPLTSGR